MKNYLKMTLGILFLVALFASHVSAGYDFDRYTYTDRYDDTILYREDTSDGENGFTLTHRYSMPIRGYSYGCDYHDHTVNQRKCARSAYYGGYDTDYSYRPSYDGDKALQQAFRTYQQSAKYEYQLESQRIKMMDRRYYGGHGYGYSGARYYRYGW